MQGYEKKNTRQTASSLHYFGWEKNNEHILGLKPWNMMFLNVQSEKILKLYAICLTKKNRVNAVYEWIFKRRKF